MPNFLGGTWLISLTIMTPLVVAGGCGEAKVAIAKPVPLVGSVVVAKVDYGPTTCLTGEVKPRVQTNLSFRVSGRIIERTAEVGDHVTPDTILARIDPVEQRADVIAAEASVRSSKALVRQTTAAFERQKTLIKQGFTTQKDYDQAEEALRTAEGSLEVAKAQLGSARDSLSFTELRSGAAGIITARNAEAGQVAQAAQTMFSLAEDGARDAVFQVYEAAFLHKVTSDTIKLSLVSNPQVSASGVVREVSPSADTVSGTVRVKVTINNPPPQFSLGAVVSGCAQLMPQQVVMLPASALTRLDAEPAVWIVEPKSRRVSLKPVSVASYDTQHVIIDGGLEPGEIVVTTGAKMLRPQQIVTLEGEKAS
jgi:membrane fusion protein, multidrug efflux system